MTYKKRTVLEPEYMKDFHCIGQDCEDSCCIGWRVQLDKKTYLGYKKNNDPELKPIIKKMVNRNRQEKGDGAYGKINMEQGGRCPFLNKEGLCKIYINAGEERLSDACALYPRNAGRIDGKFERSATISCPEIARLALLNPDGICFVHIEENINNKIVLQNKLNTEGHHLVNKPQKYFWDIRIFSLSLLQNRNYNLGERLIILGIVYNKIDKLESQNSMEDLPSMLEDMNMMIESGSLKEELGKVSVNTQIQMRLVQEMMHEKIVQGITSKSYLECLRETMLGIGYVNGEDIENALKNYNTNYKEYFNPYLEEKGYILENYLVNEYFRELMPFGKYETIWDSYIFLCVIYGMVKLHLIGMAGYYKGLNDDLTLKVIQSFSKVVLHNDEYIQGIIKLLKDNGYDSLGYMSILVKN